jgi:hypothetical protein
MRSYSVTVYREVRQAVVIKFEAESRPEAASIAMAMSESAPEDGWTTQNVLSGGIVSITEVK